MRDNVSGIYLDSDTERLIKIELSPIESKEVVKINGMNISEEVRTYGEFAFLGDFHYGNTNFSTSVVHGYLKYLKEHPNIQIGLMGDILEYGEGSNFIKDEAIPIDDQISQFVSDFKPLADRIRFILWGNHEERYTRASKLYNLMRVLALELGIDPDKGKCHIGEPMRGIFVSFVVGAKTYGAYVQHSKTNARVNQDIQLSRAGSQNVVALLVHGHTHRLIWKPRTFRSIEYEKKMAVNVVRRQYLLATGCFLKYPAYAEASSMPYTEVGSPIVKFFSDHDEMSEYDLTNKYREYLTRGGITWHHGSGNISNVGLRSILESGRSNLIPVIPCEQCHKPFRGSHSTQRFCSPKCSQESQKK